MWRRITAMAICAMGVCHLWAAASAFAQRVPGPGGVNEIVPVNSQKSLIDAVGAGFIDSSWAYPKDLLPTEFPELKHLSGPHDAGLSPKSAWRKPLVLREKSSGVHLALNCFRQRDEQAKVPTAGTPIAPLMEPNYEYQPIDFHDLRAGAAEMFDRYAMVFRSGDVLYKIEASGENAQRRQRAAQRVAEQIWESQQKK